MSCKVVHCKKEPYDVYIGRPSKWGNPYTHIKNTITLAEFVVETRDEAIFKYEEWLFEKSGLLYYIPELKNKILGCWCKPLACHGDVLASVVNKLP